MYTYKKDFKYEKHPRYKVTVEINNKALITFRLKKKVLGLWWQIETIYGPEKTSGRYMLHSIQSEDCIGQDFCRIKPNNINNVALGIVEKHLSIDSTLLELLSKIKNEQEIKEEEALNFKRKMGHA